MLQTIRDRLTGPVVWFVVGLITVPFAFFGIRTLSSGGGDPLVAKVGDTKITRSKLQSANERRYAQFVQQRRGQIPDNFDHAKFRQDTLDEMIDQSSMREFAQDSGYRVGDGAILSYLENFPYFQKDGKFSVEVYHEKLSSQPGLTPDAFEAGIREQLVADQVTGTVQDTAFSTPADAWEEYRLERQARKIGVAQIQAASFKDKVQVTDAQVAARFETDKGRYQSPERIKLSYVELDRNKVRVTDTPTTEQLKALYDETKDSRFTNPEERHARHILVTFGADKAASKKKAEDLLASIKGGKDFAKVAEESSEDTGSKARGGDLDFVRKGMTAPAFEAALFDLKAGEVAGPIETSFGWHLIKLDAIRPAGTKPFEDPSVAPELTDAWRGKQSEKKFQDLSTKLENVAFEKTDIAEVAKELGLEVQKTDWITRAGGEGIAAVDGVKQAAFSSEVVTDGANSKPIATDADHLVVIHKAEYEASHQRPLEEVKDQIRAVLLAEGEAQMAKKEGDALVADLESGKALEAAAAAHGGAVKFEGEANRHQKDVDAAILDSAFKMPRPGKAAEYRVVDLPGGDVAVVTLVAVTDPAKPADGDDTFKQQKASSRDELSAVELEAYRKALQKAVKIDRRELPPEENQEPGT